MQDDCRHPNPSAEELGKPQGPKDRQIEAALRTALSGVPIKALAPEMRESLSKAILEQVVEVVRTYGFPDSALRDGGLTLPAWLDGELAELGRLREREGARTRPAQPDLPGIAAAVAARLDVLVAEMRGDSRVARIVWARHVAMALSRALTDRSLAEIGAWFMRDHSTVSSAVHSVAQRVSFQRGEDPSGQILAEVLCIAKVLDPVAGPRRVTHVLLPGNLGRGFEEAFPDVPRGTVPDPPPVGEGEPEAPAGGAQ